MFDALFGSYDSTLFEAQISTLVPEPGTLALVMLGGLALIACACRKALRPWP